MQSVPPVEFLLDWDGDVESQEPSAGDVDFSGTLKNKYLRISLGEKVELLFSPFTPLHLQRRRLVYHRWVGAWASIDCKDVTEKLTGFSRTGHERISKQRVTDVSRFRPYRVLCPKMSGEDIAGRAPCPVCDLNLSDYGWEAERGLRIQQMLEPSSVFVLEV